MNNNNAPRKQNNGIKSCNKNGESIPFTLNDDRPSTPTGQRTSPKTVEFWSEYLAIQRKNKNYKK